MSAESQARAAKRMVGLVGNGRCSLRHRGVRDAPPGLRIWGGATMETADIEALLPWLDWAFAQVAADDAAWSSQTAP